ncbi:MAG TPA: hypothetical protein VK745_10835 [Polyangiaceae bacterium]|nr:hypothetical protein [Polyangiaceae bacterium]
MLFRYAAVLRILRHRDPRITTEICGHLAPGYLQAEVDRLHFGATVPDAIPRTKSPSSALGAEIPKSSSQRPAGDVCG